MSRPKKLIPEMFDGSLAGTGPWEALFTFMLMIVMSDDDGVVDIAPGIIARRAGAPLDIIQKGISALEAPDTESRTPDSDGRRIVRLDAHRSWGWRIVNHHKYQKQDPENTDTMPEALPPTIRKFRHPRRRVGPGTSGIDAGTSGVRDSGQDPELPAYLEDSSTKNGGSSQTTAVQELRTNQLPQSATTRATPDAGTSGMSLDHEWTIIRAAYPPRIGDQDWRQAEQRYRAHRERGVPYDEILAGVKRYYAHNEALGNLRTPYVKAALSFFGPQRHWEKEWELPSAPVRRQNGAPAGGARNDDAIARWLHGSDHGK